MLIVNADDWGGWKSATDATLTCYVEKRITSVTAMVFMEDSMRAAALAKECGVDVGLHVNLNQSFSGAACPLSVRKSQDRLRRFLGRGKYTVLLYNPFLRKEFRVVYQAQADEFVRLYGKPPSHIDGHRHMHLCSNMLLDRIIPDGQKVRRNFSFLRGEKNLINRTYRCVVDQWLSRRYHLTDYFFALSKCLQDGWLPRLVELAKVANVELMTHPETPKEYNLLMSDVWLKAIQNIRTGTYSELQPVWQ